uniref:Uncharacterized protein n=1 Tax=Micrurus spixii TaxID=129469 RepID=A0A2D4MZI3_9SAUR
MRPFTRSNCAAIWPVLSSYTGLGSSWKRLPDPSLSSLIFLGVSHLTASATNTTKKLACSTWTGRASERRGKRLKFKESCIRTGEICGVQNVPVLLCSGREIGWQAASPVVYQPGLALEVPTRFQGV